MRRDQIRNENIPKVSASGESKENSKNIYSNETEKKARRAQKVEKNSKFST